MQAVLATLRYKQRVHRNATLLILGLLVALFVLFLLIPQFSSAQYTFTNFTDGSLFSICMIIFLITFAHSDTTFLCSRPLTRRGIWLGGMAYIVLYAAFLALVRMLLSLACYGAVSLLAEIAPTKYAMAAPTAWGAFYPSRSLTVLWAAFKDLLAVGLTAYAYGCLLRRWRGWTIAISILAPLLLLTLTVMPTVYLLLNDLEIVLESNDLATMMQVLPGWMSVIQRIVNWFVEYFDYVYWTVVAASVPVGFFVMRTTRQT